MSIRETEYLSKLPIDVVKQTHQQWPNPLILAATLIGLVMGVLWYGQGVDTQSNPEHFTTLMVVFLVIIISY